MKDGGETLDIRTVLVGERITGVSVVSYAIEEEGELRAVMDVAVVIRTKHSAYTFWRGVWFRSSMSQRVTMWKSGSHGRNAPRFGPANPTKESHPRCT